MCNAISILAASEPILPSWSAPGAAMKPFVAELLLFCTIIAVLLVPFFTRRSNGASALVSLVGLSVSLLALLIVRPDASVEFRGMLVSDSFAFLWKILLLF